MRVVVVDDDFGVLHSIKRVLSSKGFEVVALQSSEGLEEYLPESNLLLMDIRLEGERGTDVVEKLRAKGFNIPVIFITAYADADAVVSASRLGAVDVLKKPFSSKELLQAVKNALEFVPKLEPSYSKELKVVGSSRAMFEVFKKVGLACQNELNVLITGETGVGKEVVAKLIHENSPRREGPFVNTTLPGNTLGTSLRQSSLVIVKGAFTGALVDKKGRLSWRRAERFFWMR
jgi:DNA-binding NtrC family response regulator